MESRDDDTSFTTFNGTTMTNSTNGFNGFNGFNGTNFNNTNFNGTNRFGNASNRTATQQMFINELRFSAAKSIRTSTIILASFNIIAAFATAVGILCDGYFQKKRNDRQWRFW